jgi:hypothetical protein
MIDNRQQECLEFANMRRSVGVNKTRWLSIINSFRKITMQKTHSSHPIDDSAKMTMWQYSIQFEWLLV